MKKFLLKHLDDIYITTGCGLLIYATYRLSLTAAIYLTGVILVVIGVLIGLGQKGSAK